MYCLQCLKTHTAIQVRKIYPQGIKVSTTKSVMDQILGTVCKAEANPIHNPSSNPKGLGAGSQDATERLVKSACQS